MTDLAKTLPRWTYARRAFKLERTPTTRFWNARSRHGPSWARTRPAGPAQVREPIFTALRFSEILSVTCHIERSLTPVSPRWPAPRRRWSDANAPSSCRGDVANGTRLVMLASPPKRRGGTRWRCQPVGAVLFMIVVLGVTACGGGNSFAANLKSNFLNACEQQGSPSPCECALKQIEAHVSQSTFEASERAQAQGASPPKWQLDAARACKIIK
jgi:hypothetical protein